MATSLSTILNWFKTGLKPTQGQYESTWTSFWHKDESLPVANVQGLATTLSSLQTQISNLSTNSIQLHGTYKNDADAAAAGCPIGGYYKIAVGSTVAAAGLIKSRNV